MKSFDNFKWLKSLNDVRNGKLPYDDSSGNTYGFYGKLTINMANYYMVYYFYNIYIYVNLAMILLPKKHHV